MAFVMERTVNVGNYARSRSDVTRHESEFHLTERVRKQRELREGLDAQLAARLSLNTTSREGGEQQRTLDASITAATLTNRDEGESYKSSLASSSAAARLVAVPAQANANPDPQISQLVDENRLLKQLVGQLLEEKQKFRADYSQPSLETLERGFDEQQQQQQQQRLGGRSIALVTAVSSGIRSSSGGSGTSVSHERNDIAIMSNIDVEERHDHNMLKSVRAAALGRGPAVKTSATAADQHRGHSTVVTSKRTSNQPKPQRITTTAFGCSEAGKESAALRRARGDARIAAEKAAKLEKQAARQQAVQPVSESPSAATTSREGMDYVFGGTAPAAYDSEDHRYQPQSGWLGGGEDVEGVSRTGREYDPGDSIVHGELLITRSDFLRFQNQYRSERDH